MKNRIFIRLVFSSALLILLMFNLIGCEILQKELRMQPSQQHPVDIEMWVKVFEDPERESWQKPDEVVNSLNLKPGNVVADIGAGTGYFTRRFAIVVGHEGKVLGLDIEPAMVNYMKKDAKKLNLKNYEARHVKADDPDLKIWSVDVVFLCNTYHHIENRVDYFKSVSYSLRENGRLVIVDFYKKTLPVGPPVDHKLSKEAVIEELQQAGYRLIQSHDFLPYQYFLEFKL